MGSQPCCCKTPQDPIQEMKLKMEQRNTNFQIFVADLKKPIPLEQILPLQEEDDFALFLVMEQYDRLITKNKRKSKSYSPHVDILSISKENLTSYYLKSKSKQKPSKKTRSLTTKLSTSFQSQGIRSILKKKELINNKSQYFQQVSDVQKSVKSVHFDVALSPKNSINRKVNVLKKKIFLRSYL
ncbi:unnamed protein product (macronuclear) [Paramecium tetraurelia]|uniref:Uncharacterized protein n=1 Tax=Paramecium tetraurelia TaxID=5888 RepID=A0D769_PARTE|nr:uncharacterized protein GSPATT00001927001 [Paramecium tetraurelia]CAK78886.1 unnamed protein product [Paramecium tetraurelia]|eukprot:XP_001446283.1 hypothetical protein (macronuclear) [Paramecium tetraurelia strain d4-2]